MRLIEEEPPASSSCMHVNVLAPYLARLNIFALMMESTSIPAYWMEARLSPLYKKAFLYLKVRSWIQGAIACKQ